MREAYRVQKHDLLDAMAGSGKQFGLLFIFTGRQLPDYAYVHGRTTELLRRMLREIRPLD
jgi:hypothetical protein